MNGEIPRQDDKLRMLVMIFKGLKLIKSLLWVEVTLFWWFPLEVTNGEIIESFFALA